MLLLKAILPTILRGLALILHRPTPKRGLSVSKKSVNREKNSLNFHMIKCSTNLCINNKINKCQPPQLFSPFLRRCGKSEKKIFLPISCDHERSHETKPRKLVRHSTFFNRKNRLFVVILL